MSKPSKEFVEFLKTAAPEKRKGVIDRLEGQARIDLEAAIDLKLRDDCALTWCKLVEFMRSAYGVKIAQSTIQHYANQRRAQRG